MTDKDEIHKRTLAKMFHGAKMEHQKHDELVTARKKLKTQLEVNFHLKLVIKFILGLSSVGYKTQR